MARTSIPRAALLIALAVWSQAARADNVEDFYRGKIMTISVAFTPGGGHDAYGRLLARFMGQHIPGHPGIVVQDMPGAGSQRAAQYIYSVAPLKTGIRR